ncbi:MAG: class I SAM-dependent methyltransferase [Clostridia bacterium]|nr:class I SAM-dependent methyltransferase [Clostridia bacterium]
MGEVARHYDKLIEEGQDPVYDPPILQDYMNKWDGQEFIDRMLLDKSKSVLEIGVGTGRIAVKTAPLCKKFTGIDISKKTIEKAKENVKKADLICADFLEYEFSETFDVVYSSLTFLHIREKKKAFDKIAKILNNDGLFVLSVDKNRDEFIDTGTSKIRVYPDNAGDIKRCADDAELTLIEEYETEFALIFIFIK